MADRRRFALLVLLLLTMTGLSGLAGTAMAASAEPSSGPVSSPVVEGTDPRTHVDEPFPKTTSECTRRVLDALSLEERVGQLFMLGIGSGLGSSERKLIASRHIGSVTFAAFIQDGVAGIRRTTDAVQALAITRTTHHVGFLVAANQEGGQVQALNGAGFSRIPAALVQGKLTVERLKEDAHRWGHQLAEAGVNLDLASVGDVVPTRWVSINAPIGQLEREFGHAPDVVESHVRAFIEGMHTGGVLTTVKHFPGLGRVRGNTDFASGVHDRTTRPGDPFLRPFRVAIAAGVPFVMTSLASYAHLDGRTLAAFSHHITTGMLREDMGFGGVIISDDLSAVAVRSTPAGQRAIKFLRAGGDMVVATRVRDARAMATTLAEKANTSASFRKLVDRSALRVLQAKESAGLLTCGT